MKHTMMMHPRLFSARLLPHIHPLLQRWFPQALWLGDTRRREVALTFDDGPHQADTPRILDVLAKHGVTATFFFIGEQVPALGALVHDVAAAGHQIAIHGYHHRPFPLERASTLHEQLDRTRGLLAEASGCAPDTLRDVRPPFGVFTRRTLHRLQCWNYRPVMWSVVPLHWLQTAEQAVRQVLHETRAGALIVLHEGQAAGPSVAHLTDMVLTRLRERGFRFVTIEHMWHLRKLP